MKQRAYIIRWYGPFHSRQELKEWELEYSGNCRLYLIKGKKTHKQKYSIYCGMTFKQMVCGRFSNHNHHIREIENRENELEIWAGTFVNATGRLNKEEVSLCENLLIHTLNYISAKENLDFINDKSYLAPVVPVSIINEWYYAYDTSALVKRRLPGSIPSVMPDVTHFNGEELLWSDRLK